MEFWRHTTMNTHEIWRAALRAALNSPSCDPVEICKCFEAIARNSPVVRQRIAHALRRAMECGGLDYVPATDRERIYDAIALAEPEPGMKR
jgi:hypothetical protein